MSIFLRCCPEYHPWSTSVHPLYQWSSIKLKGHIAFLFVDDTKCLHAAKTRLSYRRILPSLVVGQSHLPFNCNKRAVLHFWCNQETPVNYTLNNNPIDSRDSIKGLRIITINDLSWSLHCSMITSRAYKQLCLIHCSFATNCKKTLYFPGQITTPSYIVLKFGNQILLRILCC